MGKAKRNAFSCDDRVAIQAAILEWVSDGGTVRSFCRLPGMPNQRTISRWTQEEPQFAAAFLQAKDEGYDAISQDVLDIIDSRDHDDPEDVQRRKMRAEYRLKLLAKWDPRRYGDKAQVEHQGGVSIRVVTGVPPAGNGE